MSRLSVVLAVLLVGACTVAQPLDHLSSGDCRVDGAKNGDESDVDCGGRDLGCARCRLDATCRSGSDCTTGACSVAGRCECPREMTAVAHADGVVPVRTCIDYEEVSNDSFAEFVAACPDGCPKHRPAECAFETSFAPRTTEITTGAEENATNCYREVNPANRDGGYPVVCIDWCAAYTYCAWRGKRLCGLLDHAAQNSEWADACSYKGTRTFPYSPPENPSQYDACACNAQDDSGEVTCGETTMGAEIFPVDSPLSCVSESSALNLVGNAAEWEDACDRSSDPVNDKCPLRGGSFASPKARASCTASPDFLERSHARTDVGFRCCSG
jgi:formylglycine-generating enzyme